ncbi:hypothetical protein AVHY2522_24870 [Acidovorax sp. SUPP2522]|nr:MULTISPECIES: hypothetical protein [unclassified Acidovorax]WCM97872.1 hypothetical protein M5C96_26475 [Acidovorax sp. GBBC 1281]GKT20136.1 hypothetical protein AVHY2522_24870 [Acidovorax sp. SUPP2522]
MEAIQPMDQDKVNKQLRKMRLPTIGPELTAHALADTTLNNRLFDVRVGTDPSTTYQNESNGSAWTFDDITEDLLAHQAQGRRR